MQNWKSGSSDFARKKTKIYVPERYFNDDNMTKSSVFDKFSMLVTKNDFMELYCSLTFDFHLVPT